MTVSSKPVVVVVGSLHYDIMVDAPDRPRKGETVTGYAWRPKFGGKGGNQAVAAAKAGAEVRMAGAVGATSSDDSLDALAPAASMHRVSASPRGRVGHERRDLRCRWRLWRRDRSGANSSSIPPPAEPGLWQGARALILQNEMPDAINVSAARAQGRWGRGLPQRRALSPLV